MRAWDNEDNVDADMSTRIATEGTTPGHSDIDLLREY